MTPAQAEGSLLGDLLFVVGLRREAGILGPRRRIAIGAAGLEAALGERRPSGIVSFGLCGALRASLRPGNLVLATEVADARGAVAADAGLSNGLARALADVVRGRILGSDAIVGDADGKAALAASTGAVAVDMESQHVARAAQRAELPYAVLRAVSDAADESLPRAAQAGFRPDGEVDVAAVIIALARRPWEIAGLIRTARSAGAGFDALQRAAASLPD